MWEKIKKWWRKKRWEHRRKNIDLETALWESLVGQPVVPGTMHVCSWLIVSLYFEQDKDWNVVDLSQWEETGVAHFIMFTKDSRHKWECIDQTFTTGWENGLVYMVEFDDGSCGWCYK